MENVTNLQTASVGRMIDNLFDLREKKRKLQASIKELEEQMAPLEEHILKHLDDQGTLRTASKTAIVSISEQEVPHVIDWESFWKYISRNKYYHLVQRRVSAAAFREVLAARRNKPIPGSETVTVRKLNLRKAS